MTQPEILRASDCTFLIRFGNEISRELSQKTLSFFHFLNEKKLPGVLHLQPAFSSLLLHFDLSSLDLFQNGLSRHPDEQPSSLIETLHSLLKEFDSIESPVLPKKKTVEIPVCYEEPFAPDLKELARELKKSPVEIVSLHSQTEYFVCFLGFMPGFGYLGGLPQGLTTSRLSVPRLVVPEGSVGLAGNQTGIYPQATPGGWRLIGRTPLKMFDVTRDPPSLLSPGDTVIFRPISIGTFEDWGKI